MMLLWGMLMVATPNVVCLDQRNKNKYRKEKERIAMDLGLKSKKALVCGGSAGLGKAIALSLTREGAKVTIVSRDSIKLDAAKTNIKELTGRTVATKVCDLSSESNRNQLNYLCEDIDILINNSGGPPLGGLESLSLEDWRNALESNMLAGIDLMKKTIPTMRQRSWGRILNITSAMVKSPHNSLSLSNGSRAGLTGFSAGLAREVAKYNITINNLLPGQFVTERLNNNHRFIAEQQKISVDAYQERARSNIPAKRFGNPEEFGEWAAFLCSEKAAYMTGQNILLDGGQFPGLL